MTVFIRYLFLPCHSSTTPSLIFLDHRCISGYASYVCVLMRDEVTPFYIHQVALQAYSWADFNCLADLVIEVFGHNKNYNNNFLFLIQVPERAFYLMTRTLTHNRSLKQKPKKHSMDA